MPGLWEAFYVLEKLLKSQAPRVYQHLKDINLSPEMYASQWFITLFTVGFNYEWTVRVYDAFFTEGYKIIYRVALWVLKSSEDHLISGGVEEIFAVIKIFMQDANADELMKAAVDINITNKQIEKYEKEYQDNLKNKA